MFIELGQLLAQLPEKLLIVAIDNLNQPLLNVYMVKEIPKAKEGRSVTPKFTRS